MYMRADLARKRTCARQGNKRGDGDTGQFEQNGNSDLRSDAVTLTVVTFENGHAVFVLHMLLALAPTRVLGRGRGRRCGLQRGMAGPVGVV